MQTKLSKKQLKRIIKHAIDCQNNISKRTDGHDEFNRIQFQYFKALYKTAFHYFCNQKGYVIDGIKMFDYNELIEVNTLLEKQAA